MHLLVEGFSWRSRFSIASRGWANRAFDMKVQGHEFEQGRAEMNPAQVTRRDAALRLLASLARRAQAAGALRRDLTINNLVPVLLAGRALGSLPVRGERRRPGASPPWPQPATTGRCRLAGSRIKVSMVLIENGAAVAG
ncbi:hypothetical protein HZU40_11960 [Mycolicibacterium fluoranthenivorans]|uniref:Uncharacterized protein n=1 Tax=Mycolicibacterium fluoranthenivorans TaxID=258505 RepID=A0A7G8PKM3_9MYCO|nr:hypothetical protein [Mycolicibacterium fluoranthenivorans]QNJ94889.1 hypothetical protein HZU40_11960 [Mycolicibacterium fluoranthenivorans]